MGQILASQTTRGVADGVMLMAGLGGACFRENGKWHSIFTSGDMGKLLLDQTT